jgi:CRP-like cAMP-binding protein
LIKGRISAVLESDLEVQKRLELIFLGGNYFGDLDVILEQERTFNAIAECGCEVWKVDG